jgi:holo-[acyl-carrier protein] synthase
MKAIGTGWAEGVRWSDFEIVNSASGRPEMKLSGKAAEIAAALGCRAVHVSLSHTKRMAIAHVVLDG